MGKTFFFFFKGKGFTYEQKETKSFLPDLHRVSVPSRFFFLSLTASIPFCFPPHSSHLRPAPSSISARVRSFLFIPRCDRANGGQFCPASDNKLTHFETHYTSTGNEKSIRPQCVRVCVCVSECVRESRVLVGECGRECECEMLP